jgi:hypothetical protein
MTDPPNSPAAWAIHAEWCKASDNKAPCYGPTDADRERARAEGARLRSNSMTDPA